MSVAGQVGLTLLLASSVLAACSQKLSGGSERSDEGAYIISITGDTRKSHDFAGTTAIWVRDLNTVTLGPEVSDGPLARMQITLGVNPLTILSTTDKREGDGQVVNGRLYTEVGGAVSDVFRNIAQANFGKLGILEIGDNYIHGQWAAVMDRVLVNPEDTPETIKMFVEFRAIAH